jgi:serine/threonine protein kinase
LSRRLEPAEWVYRARDTRLNREVAIKVLPEHLSSNPELRERCLAPASPVRNFLHGLVLPAVLYLRFLQHPL